MVKPWRQLLAGTDGIQGGYPFQQLMIGEDDYQEIGERIASMFLIRVKKADQTINNSDVLQDDNILQFPVYPNETWLVHYYMVLSQSLDLNTDIKAVLTAPTNTTGLWSDVFPNALGSLAYFVGRFSDVSAGELNFDVTGANETHLWQITAFAPIGSSGGTLKLRWAQRLLSAGQTLTMKKGSCLIATRLLRRER